MAAFLHGLHILNTRPAAQATALTQALQQAGATVSELPLITITPCSLSDSDTRLLMDLDRYDAVFFVSANAVRYGLDATANYWPQWPHQLPCYAVAEGTAAPLRHAGLTVHTPQRPDSEGFLAMPEWQHPTGKKVLIMRGVGGRDLLCQTLREQGAHVDMIELYHRELPHEAASQWQQTPRPDIVILTSPAALNHWKIIAGTHAIQPLWLVVSSRLHAQAQQEGARVCLAHSADTQSLLAALQSFYQG